MPNRYSLDGRGLAPRQAEAVAVVAGFVWRDGVSPSVADVAHQLDGVSKSTARTHLAKAVRAGALVQLKDGRYTLPPDKLPANAARALFHALLIEGRAELFGRSFPIGRDAASWGAVLWHHRAQLDELTRNAEAIERAALDRANAGTAAGLDALRGRTRKGTP